LFRSYIPILFSVFVLVVFVTPLFAQETTDQASSPTLQVQTKNGRQMEVWVDNERIGITPLIGRLSPGKHLMSCWNSGLEPIIQVVDIPEDDVQVLVIPDRPLKADRFPVMFERIIRAYQQFPENPHFKIIAASLAQTESDFQGMLGQMEEEDKDNALVLLADAKWAVYNEDFIVGLVTLKEAIDAEPRLAVTWRFRARVLTALKRYREAIAHADKAVVLEPQNAENFVVRGNAYRAMGKETDADLDYMYALELDPENEEALAARGERE